MKLWVMDVSEMPFDSFATLRFSHKLAQGFHC